MSSRWKPHVTVAAIIARTLPACSITDVRTQFLLVEESTLDGLRLNNPAGHLECGESLQEAVMREVLEETRRSFVPEFMVGVYMSRVIHPARQVDITYLRFAFGGTVGDESSALLLDPGIVRNVWMTFQELEASKDRHRSPSVMQGVRDFIAGQRLPLSAIYVDPALGHPEPRLA
jgi:ADP-ribose pyrophosphatase YjhB (NUDIX family)